MTRTVERAICPRLALVIPCSKEELVLTQTSTRIASLLEESIFELATMQDLSV